MKSSSTIRIQSMYAVFARVKRMISIVSPVICACLLVSTVAPAQVSTTRFLVRSVHILTAMQTRQLPTQGVEVEITAPVTAAVDNPQLDIRSGALINTHAIRLRIACHIQSQCLPFFALAKWPDAVDTSTLPIKLERTMFHVKNDDSKSDVAKSEQKLSTEIPVRSITQSISLPNPTTSMHDSSLRQVSADQPLLRKGSSATLMIEGDKLHITLAVICLEGGSAGDTIRVATLDHKQSYKAQVVTDRLLKGIL